MSTPALQTAENRSSSLRQGDGLTTLFGSGTSSYGVDKRSFVLAYLLNSLAMALLIYSSYWAVSHQEQIKAKISQTVVDISPYIMPSAKDASGGGGGGGDRDKLLPPKGKLPKQARDQFTPPA